MRFARRSGMLFLIAIVTVGCGRSRFRAHGAVAAAPATAASAESTAPPPPQVDQWLVTADRASELGWPSASCTSLVSGLLFKMTLNEKIGQMTQPDRGQMTGPGDVGKFVLGSVLSGGGSSPPRNEPAAWLSMVNDYAAFANNARLKIPLIYGIDAVHGHNNVKGAVIYPHNVGLGCTRDPELVERIARATAEEMAATGIDWTFSPVVAAARDERWGRTYEAFGETSELAESLGAAAIRGYQGQRLGQAAPAVLACAKHFVADGGTWSGHDRGDSIVDAQAMFDNHLRQYQAAIKAGVGSIMVSYSSVNGVKMHARRDLLTDILKGRLGFPGFLVSDYAAIEQLPGNYAVQVQAAINAGIDMVMGPKHFQNFISTLVVAGAAPRAT